MRHLEPCTRDNETRNAKQTKKNFIHWVTCDSNTVLKDSQLSINLNAQDRSQVQVFDSGDGVKLDLQPSETNPHTVIKLRMSLEVPDGSETDECMLPKNPSDGRKTCFSWSARASVIELSLFVNSMPALV